MASGLFRDMLQDSIASSSLDKPLPLDENSADLEIMFSIMTGRQQEVLDRAKDWEQAARLYRLVDKYQIDGLRPWFAQICCAHAMEEPWEALFLACNQSPMDKSIIRASIAKGFRNKQDAALCDTRYLKHDTVWYGDRQTSEKVYVLDSSNTTVELGFKLGLKGFLAYHQTFQTCQLRIPNWYSLAERFIENAIAIERKACNGKSTSRALLSGSQGKGLTSGCRSLKIKYCAYDCRSGMMLALQSARTR
jgi:hypothetical protein